MPVMLTCTVCGGPFSVPPSVAKFRKTCSRECRRGRPYVRGPAELGQVKPCLEHLLSEGYATVEELAGLVEQTEQYIIHRLWYYQQMGLVERVYQLTPAGVRYMKNIQGRKADG